jgi:dihydrofolate synthase/folylpolyglutamate synthase
VSDIEQIEAETAFREWSERTSSDRRSLGRARSLASALGLLQNQLPVVGVVGSKGKGTTAVYASSLLSARGLKVGTVLSPGLISNMDRIRVDGENISEVDYVSALKETSSALERLPPQDTGYVGPSGFFMLAALWHFKLAGCDVAVVEAGIGGLSDELSLLELRGLAVSQIFLEHTEILGDTLGEIATDKVGVASSKTRFVAYLAQSSEAEDVISGHSKIVGADLIRIDDATIASFQHVLPPGLSAQNAALGLETARAYLRSSRLSTPDAADIGAAAAAVQYPGRLSRHRNDGHDIIVDSAVSREGLIAALRFAETAFAAPPKLVLVSIPINKDFHGFEAELLNYPSRVVFVDMQGSHLPYPTRKEWPRDWAESASLAHLVGSSETVLAVGTVTFSAAVLKVIGVDTSRVFHHPGAQSGRPLG